ncbi:hypothetical protein JAAARDRAFT_203912 [Jaapia argillacea MUCL 33604]|uniref:Peptidase A1 domain-containing protein n=1 Tax=Jaapia argillacea MUCL 33604 TaxID=933084 RepID=A0A067QCZ2_9AGAM|nr:hypothetical protein JAAARDRAFT_203912 [Jaapia argillacea MUCL 33604]
MIVGIDSGSSDVWVYPPSKLQLTNRTSIHGILSYGEGFVQGFIDFAELKIGPYTVPSQAFINVQNYTEEDGHFEQGIYGILGLAFDNSSTADVLLKPAYERTTLSLRRADDLASTPEGEFPIFHGFQTFPAPPSCRAFLRLHSTVASTPKGSNVAVLDTGYTLPPLPRPLVDFIYGNISGAVYDKEEDVWIVPCLNTTDLEFTLGGDAFVIHPADIMKLTTIELPNGSSVTYCFNTY